MIQEAFFIAVRSLDDMVGFVAKVGSEESRCVETNRANTPENDSNQPMNIKHPPTPCP